MPPLEHVKTVTVAGKVYRYFVTLRKTPKGRPVMVRLPDMDHPTFWQTYAAHMSARSNQVEAAAQLSVPALMRLYMLSPKFAKLARSTRDVYALYLGKFADNFEPAPAADILRKDVLHIAERMKPGAANMFVAAISSLYAWGRYRGHVENDPCKDIEKNEGGEHEPWPIELVEAALVSDDPVIRLAVHLLYYTAQRIGDVCAMRWTDIAGPEVHVVQQKTGTPLTIRIHKKLGAELARHPRSFETILSRGGKPWAVKALRKKLQDWATAKGYKIVPHGLRKNAVNALLEAGCTVAQTSAISGQTLQVVEHYAKRRDTTKLGSAAILNWERGQNTNAQRSGK